MKAFILLLIMTISIADAQAGSISRAGLCSNSESTFFSCQTKNQKWISLCGKLPENLQYRFGISKLVDFKHPENAATGIGDFTFAHFWRFQTDRLEIGFSNNGADYALFDYTEEGKRRAGVRITNGDGKEREIVCTGPITSRLGDLEKVLKCDPDNALNGGNCDFKH